MEQWTEQTSLRLLELVASTAIAMSAPDGADFRQAENAAPVIEALAALAATDSGFQHWLVSRSSAAPTAQSAVVDWQYVAEHWLTWLAAEPRAEAAQVSVCDQPRVALPGSEQLGECALRGERSERYRRLLTTNAQATLRLGEVLAERALAREETARGLAYDMAYGLSHELNNPLANIATRARVLAEEETNQRKKHLLSAIVDQAMRGCEMIADLMLIARPPFTQLGPIDLGGVAREVIAKARPWAEARGVNLIVHLGEAPVTATSDRAALIEAAWVLLRNALEVARQQIAVTVSATHVSPEASATNCAMLSIHDDGPGLSSRAQAHAFNPFFSGREAGRGLGVGLAKADRIARLSGGRVTVANAPGGGCVARLELPLAEG